MAIIPQQQTAGDLYRSSQGSANKHIRLHHHMYHLLYRITTGSLVRFILRGSRHIYWYFYYLYFQTFCTFSYNWGCLWGSFLNKFPTEVNVSFVCVRIAESIHGCKRYVMYVRKLQDCGNYCNLMVGSKACETWDRAGKRSQFLITIISH